MMTQRIETTDGQGNVLEVREIEVPDLEPTPATAALAAVETARAGVAGLSPAGATRQAVEALASAVEALAQSI